MGWLRAFGLPLLVVGILALPGAAQGQSADDLVVGYRALGASSLVRESYEVEVLRWTAISELVNASISSNRLGVWQGALPGIQTIAGVYDRDADTLGELAQSVDAVEAVARSTPFTIQSEAETWATIVQGGIEEVVADALAIFSSRSSSTEGIEALGLGIRAERALDASATSKLQPLLDSENELLAHDLEHAERLVQEANDWAAISKSDWSPVRFVLLHRSLDHAQAAGAIYHRHGALEQEQEASQLASALAADIRGSLASWAMVVLVSTGIVLGLSVYVQHRLATWNLNYAHARRANFLMGAPR